jgi:hypothetical protein
MKKIAVIFAVAAVALAVSGCKKSGDQEQFEQKEQAREQGGIVSSIKEAMGLGQKMKCTYTTTANGKTFESVVYVDGQKYKSEAEVNGVTHHSLFDGEAVYSWSDEDKSGATKMEKKCLDELNAMLPKQESETSGDLDAQFSAEAFESATDVKCEAAAGVDMSIPSDIIFNDACEAMKQQIKALEEMEKNMNQNMRGIPDSEDYRL